MSQQFAAGTPVYNATGSKIGTVSAPGVQGNYLLVRRGRIFRKTVYVPLDAIRRSDGRGIYLRLYKPYVTEPDDDEQDGEFPFQLLDDDDTLTAATGAATWPSVAPVAEEHGDLRVPLREERVFVEKRAREKGRVHIHKYVVEEPQTMTVAVTHEEFRIARVPVTGHIDPGPNVFTETHVEMSLMGEDVIVDKRTRIVEEVHLYKSQVAEEHAVNEVVHKERLHIDGASGSNGQTQPPDRPH